MRIWPTFALSVVAVIFCTLPAKGGIAFDSLCELLATNTPPVSSTNILPESPSGELTEVGDGSFWGVTPLEKNDSTSTSFGSIYRVTKSGVLTRIFTFNGTNGLTPSGAFTLGSDGSLYGTTLYGGTNGSPSSFQFMNGTIYKISTNGAFTKLFAFNGTNGSNPNGTLAVDNDGGFIGVARYGGVAYSTSQTGDGTIFKFTTNGIFTKLFDFGGTNGSYPVQIVLSATDGNFYGVTRFGGIGYTGPGTGNGTIFEFTTNGVFTNLVYFNGTNGSWPSSGPVVGNDGSLYGTTLTGGQFNNYGTIYCVTKDGGFTTLYSFDGSVGARPYSKLVFGFDGNLYGTTIYHDTNFLSGNGAIFRITTNGVPTQLVVFGGTQGRRPTLGMTLSSDGNFYGALNDSKGQLYSDGSSGAIYRLVQQPALNAPMPINNGGAVISWASFTNAVYQVEYTTDLVFTNWTVLATNVIATSNSVSYTDSSLNSTQRFYRVRLMP
jgi:uncharacterized repeat protein (TIGR03803 family)